MSLTLLLFSLILFQHSICPDPIGCIYKDTSTRTDGGYLKPEDDEKTNINKCFSLSYTNFNAEQCCYYKDGNNQFCADQNQNSGLTLECPKDSLIANNCGMSLYFQPKAAESCTEISLVDGFCCYVQTKAHGTACVRTDELDEDKKTKITDKIRDAVKKLKLTSTTVSGDVEITAVTCEGYYMKFFGISFLLLAVML